MNYCNAVHTTEEITVLISANVIHNLRLYNIYYRILTILVTYPESSLCLIQDIRLQFVILIEVQL